MVDAKQFHPEARLAAAIVAHPDDETLWAGGQILALPRTEWFIMTLCRRSDADRAPRFAQAARCLHAHGIMADLDDSPEQVPLEPEAIQQAILAHLPQRAFDLVLTHGPAGEYTRHRRHEEVCRAVVALWHAGKLTARQVWMFAYEDGGRRYLPRPDTAAHFTDMLAGPIWREKYRLITEIYGFAPDSWEARTTPHHEAFWRFDSPQRAREWVDGWGLLP
jgi:LmbE family N-acetylglucosaminyl deacetylase